MVLLLSFCTCGIASFIMLPWYIWRFTSWTRLNDAHEALRSSLSAHGDLAVRFQRAWGKLVIGICIGAILWIGVSFNAFRRVYLSTPYVVHVDPARHEGPDRIKLDPFNISLVRPESFQTANSPERKLTLEGPLWPLDTRAIPAKINVSAVPYPTPQPIEEFPQRLLWQRIGSIQEDYELLEQGNATIDEKPGYYVKMRINLLPDEAPHNQKWVTVTEYYVIGYNHLYTIAFLTAQDALPENQPAFDQALKSIRVD